MVKVNKNAKFLTKNIAKTKNVAFSSNQNKVVTSQDKTKLLNKTISPISSTSKKKDKIRQKRKNLMNKFTLFKKQQKEERARKNREKTAVIGDLKPLKDALPSLDELFKLSKKDELKTGVKDFDSSSGTQGTEKLSAKAKIKLNKEKFMQKVNSYQALLNNPDFKKNPREAIRYHIQYTNGLIDE